MPMKLPRNPYGPWLTKKEIKRIKKRDIKGFLQVSKRIPPNYIPLLPAKFQTIIILDVIITLGKIVEEHDLMFHQLRQPTPKRSVH